MDSACSQRIASQYCQRIDAMRQLLGPRLLILGHHYQCDDVLAQSDLAGDSFQLSAKAATVNECEVIVFCGVHFMAETADILVNAASRRAARGGKWIDVVLPDSDAGCSMADMANDSQLAKCYEELAAHIDIADLTPITYVNSTAAVKAFCGARNGFACTSSNAAKVLAAAWRERKRVIFLPDQHLGRNTASAMQIAEDEMVLWNPHEPLGGTTPDALKRARVILWDGFCCVHQHFHKEHVAAIREAYPGVCVIVHPECSQGVVDAADESGSTSQILDRVAASPAGACFAIGTEYNLVQRLAKRFPDKTIVNLSASPQCCSTMALITPEKLANTLESIAAGRRDNVVRVNESVAHDACLALERMLNV
ncbi:MAG: quinolinate synthase NadA [Thermoguttaceae bacterium]